MADLSGSKNIQQLENRTKLVGICDILNHILMNLTSESTLHVIEDIHHTIIDESLEENRNMLFEFCCGRYTIWRNVG